MHSPFLRNTVTEILETEIDPVSERDKSTVQQKHTDCRDDSDFLGLVVKALDSQCGGCGFESLSEPIFFNLKIIILG